MKPLFSAGRRAVCGALLTAIALPKSLCAKVKDGDWSDWPNVPDEQMLDHNGRAVRFVRDLVHGRVFVMNFIFTGCTTVCPPQTALAVRAREMLMNERHPGVAIRVGGSS